MNNKESWLSNNYGSRRGFIRTLWHQLLYRFGRYEKYKRVEWDKVERLVFICKGNICRSVFAENVARSMDLNTISCGLDTIQNAPANADAVKVAQRLNYDLSGHQTCPIMYASLKHTDLIVAMEPWQISFLESNLKRKHQYTLLGLWSDTSLPHLQDPYGASHNYFERCFSRISSAVSTLSSKLTP